MFPKNTKAKAYDSFKEWSMSATISSRSRRLLIWLAILGAWTLIVLTFAAQAYVFAVSRSKPDRFLHEFLVASTEWYVWAALTPIVLWLCRHFRIKSQSWISPVAVHVAGSLLIALLQLAIQVRLNYIVNPGYKMGYWKVLYFFATYKLHMNLLTYWVIVALNHGIYYYEQARAANSPGPEWKPIWRTLSFRRSTCSCIHISCLTRCIPSQR